MKFKLSILLIAIFGFCITAQSQDFVYTPENPAFGGNTFNYQWMLSSANAQNNIQNPNQTDEFGSRFNRDPLENFQNQINQQILGQISSSIVNNQFGGASSVGGTGQGLGQGLNPGTYVFGTYTVDVGNTAEGISIVITDNSTGNSTEVVVPTF